MLTRLRSMGHLNKRHRLWFRVEHANCFYFQSDQIMICLGFLDYFMADKNDTEITYEGFKTWVPFTWGFFVMYENRSVM